MAKILVIPDVHGREFWKYALKHVDEYEKVVFLGDYLDPYSHEGISFDDAVDNFQQILTFKEDYSNKVFLLLGNHDMHYYDLSFMDCSRLNRQRRKGLNALYHANENTFQLTYIYEGQLFSHAGVYSDWLEEYGLNLDNLTVTEVSRCALEAVSGFRGGYDSTGSCIWADVRESLHNEIDNTYFQVFGHTQLDSLPYITDELACLDVRQCFEIDLETKKISPIEPFNHVS